MSERTARYILAKLEHLEVNSQPLPLIRRVEHRGRSQSNEYFILTDNLQSSLQVIPDEKPATSGIIPASSETKPAIMVAGFAAENLQFEYVKPAIAIAPEPLKTEPRTEIQEESPSGDQGELGFPAPKGRTSKRKGKPKAKTRAAPTETDSNLSLPSVGLYRRLMEITPNAEQRKLIAAHVEDLTAWEATCRFWLRRGYRRANVEDLVSCYESGGYQSHQSAAQPSGDHRGGIVGAFQDAGTDEPGSGGSLPARVQASPRGNHAGFGSRAKRDGELSAREYLERAGFGPGDFPAGSAEDPEPF